MKKFYIFLAIFLCNSSANIHRLNGSECTSAIDLILQHQELQTFYESLFEENITRTSTSSHCGNTTTTTTTTTWIGSNENTYTILGMHDELENFENNVKGCSDSINKKDNTGKTALNHCAFYKEYTTLRKHGANFQFDAFWKFNKSALIGSTTIMSCFLYYLYQTLKIKPCPLEKIEEPTKDNRFNAVDQTGKNTLMNYLINQEKELAKIWHNFANAKHPYNKSIYKKQYDELLLKTKKEIEEMVRKGTLLDTQDNDGNTVLNYCKTYVIYEDLLSYGTPFQYKVWTRMQMPTICLVTLIATPFIFFMYLIDKKISPIENKTYKQIIYKLKNAIERYRFNMELHDIIDSDYANSEIGSEDENRSESLQENNSEHNDDQSESGMMFPLNIDGYYFYFDKNDLPKYAESIPAA